MHNFISNHINLLKVTFLSVFIYIVFIAFSNLVFANELSILSYQKISNTSGNLQQTLQSYHNFGYSVENIGDLDNDGNADLAVSAIGAPDDGGIVYILFLNSDGIVKNSNKIAFGHSGLASDLNFGDAFGAEILALGDLDGDGNEDIAVAAPGDDDGICALNNLYCEYGALYVLFLNPDGTVKNSQKISNLAGGMEGVLVLGESFGQALANLGDVNNDGIIEIAVSSNDNSYSLNAGVGKIHILSLNSSGIVVSSAVIENSMYHNGLRTIDDARILSLVNIGDLDGDSVNDLVAGMPEGDLDRGGLRVIFMNQDLTIKSSKKIKNLEFGNELDIDSQLGMSLAVGPDTDDDGIQDLIVGAPLHNFYSDKQGSIWIVGLNSDGSLKQAQRMLRSEYDIPASYDFFGFDLSVLSGGNTNVFKLAVGAALSDDFAINSGSLYVLSIGQTSTNLAPVFSVLPTMTISEGSLQAFLTSATDTDADPLTYSATNLPTGATYNSTTGEFSWTPDYDDAGVYEVTFTVSDGSLTDSETVSIEVANTNRPPVLASIGNQTVTENQNLTFTLSATDPDADTLTYSALNLPAGATFNPTTRVFSWTPTYAQSGNYENIEFTVSDNGSPMELAVELITITVGNINRAPELSNPGPQQILEEELLSFNTTATDPDADSVSLSASGVPSGATFNTTTGTFTWTPTLTQEGIYTLTITATDNGSPVETSTVDVVITVGDNPTPVEQAEDLITLVTDFNLPTNVENAYMANLQKVGTFIEAGNIQAAINQLNAFINKVNQNYAQGKITVAQRNAMVAAAQQLIGELN